MGTAVVALGLTGCVSLPPRVAEPTGAVTKLALSPRDVEGVMKDVDARNNAVIAEIAAGGNAKAWERVDSGLTLLSDLVSTTEIRARGDKADFGAGANTAERSWSARFAAYPVWAMVERKPDFVQGRPNTDSRYVIVLERAAVTTEWKVSHGFLIDGAIPPPLAENADATVTAAETAQIADATKPFSAYLSGSTIDAPAPSKILPAVKAELDRVVIDQTSVRSGCDLWGGGAGPSGFARAVRTSDGVLGVAILRCTKTSTADPGREISWNEPHAKAIGGDTRHVQALTEVYGVTLGILVRTDGSAAVVGGNMYLVPLNALPS